MEVQDTTPDNEASIDPAGEQDVEYWKAMSRKHEDRWKSMREELDEAQSALKSANDALVEKDKSIETLNGEREALTSERDGLLREAVAASHGVPVEMIHGASREELVESANRAVEWGKSLKVHANAPLAGLKPEPPKEDPTRKAVRDLFKKEG